MNAAEADVVRRPPGQAWRYLSRTAGGRGRCEMGKPGRGDRSV